MAKTIVLNKKGLVEPPIYPCYKGEGLCQLRTIEADKVQCVYDGATCRYRKVKREKNGSHH